MINYLKPIVMLRLERNKYERFLTWLVTPQDNKESKIFKDEGFVDDYIELVNRIPDMTDKRLIDEIDNQLKKYLKIVDRGKIIGYED